MPKLFRLVSNGPAHTSPIISMSTPSGNLFGPAVFRAVTRKSHTRFSLAQNQFKTELHNFQKTKNVAFSSYINEKLYYEELLFQDGFDF